MEDKSIEESHSHNWFGLVEVGGKFSTQLNSFDFVGLRNRSLVEDF